MTIFRAAVRHGRKDAGMTHPTVKPRGRPKGEFRARLSDADI